MKEKAVRRDVKSNMTWLWLLGAASMILLLYFLRPTNRVYNMVVVSFIDMISNERLGQMARLDFHFLDRS
jgi:hypothetical protein